jgi:hypothetical protein
LEHETAIGHDSDCTELLVAGVLIWFVTAWQADQVASFGAEQPLSPRAETALAADPIAEPLRRATEAARRISIPAQLADAWVRMG